MNKIKEMPLLMRPREKAKTFGITSLSDQELLALLIRTGTRKLSAIQVAQEVLLKTNGIQGLASVKKSELKKVSGIKDAKALEILAVVEIARRMMRDQNYQPKQIADPQALMQWLNYEIGFKEQEHFMVVYLNHQLEIVHHQILFKGTLDRSLIHPRDVFREAVLHNAAALMLVHNHPGKSLTPSQADIETTALLIKNAQLLGLTILDHVIVSYGKYCSIRSTHSYLFKE